MAKIVRKAAKIFGQDSGIDQISQFGSLAAAAPVFSTDPDVIQALQNYLDGWFAGVVGANSPAIEDMNALCYLFAYQIAYLLQAGVPEWDSGTTYFVGGIVSNSGVLYVSLVNDNVSPLTDISRWGAPIIARALSINPAATPTLLMDAAFNETAICVNSVNGALTINLPALSSLGGGRFIVVDSGGVCDLSPITIVPNGTDTIQGLNVNYILNSPGGSWTFQPVGNNFVIVS